MAITAHLWAIGYDDVARADQVRKQIVELGWGAGKGAKYLILLDTLVVVRNPDGSFTLNREPLSGLANIVACTGIGFLAGLVLAAPLTSASIGALLGSTGTALAATHVGISEEFVRDVKAMMKPGTSALFVLDDEGDLEVIVHQIQGLGGTVLMTNADLERAELIQSTLAAGVSE